MDPGPAAHTADAFAAARDAFLRHHQHHLAETAKKWVTLPVNQDISKANFMQGTGCVNRLLTRLQKAASVPSGQLQGEQAESARLLQREVDNFVTETKSVFCPDPPSPSWFEQSIPRGRRHLFETLKDVEAIFAQQKSDSEKLIFVVSAQSSCSHYHTDSISIQAILTPQALWWRIVCQTTLQDCHRLTNRNCIGTAPL